MSGSITKRCGCRDAAGRQLGTGCPQLRASRHGRWSFAVDLPTLDGARKTHRRGGFATRKAASVALDDVLARFGAGVTTDDRETVAAYLTGWLADKARSRKPTTMAQYGLYVRTILIPTLGPIPLEALNHDHVRRLVVQMETSGRGVPTVRRVIAVLRSALSDAVKRHRVAHNVAQHVALPTQVRTERPPWTAAQATRFLDHIRDDRFAPLFETLIGTGLRRGEVLALRWADVDLDARVLFVRRTLSAVDNNRLVFTTPKTTGSAAGVGLSPRVVAVLAVQRERQDGERGEWGAAYEEGDLVFARANGSPIRPDYLLDHFYALTAAAGLPRVHLHDLRHLCATLMLNAGVPIALVSKVLRHTKISITSDLYGHLTRESSHAAVDAAAAALDAAAQIGRGDSVA